MYMLSQPIYDHALFEGLSTREVDGVLICIAPEIRRYGPSEAIPGQDAVGIVLDGSLTVHGPGGGALGRVEAGELFGETFFCHRCRPEQRLLAEGGAQVLYLPGAFFLRQCAKQCDNKETHQRIIRNMLRLLSDRNAALERKIAYLAAEDLRTKIAMYLLELYDENGSDSFAVPLNRDRLAAFLSVARPSLSREMAGLRNQGIIDFHRSQFTILDLPALRGIARGE